MIVTPENMRGLQLSGPEDNATVMRVEAKIPGEGNWKLSEHTVNSAGHGAEDLAQLPRRVWSTTAERHPEQVSSRQPMSACFQRLADDGYKQHISYHPPSHFWGLQWREFGLFVPRRPRLPASASGGSAAT